MKFNRRNPKCYVAHIKCLTAMLIAYVLSLKWLKQKQSRPAVMMYSHSLSGNIKAFFDYTIEKVNLPYETYYATIDKQEYKKLSKVYGDRILLGTRVSVAKKILNAGIMMTSHGPGVFYFLKWLSPNVKFVDVWHGLGFKKPPARAWKLYEFYSALFVSSEYVKETLYKKHFGFSDSRLIVTGYARTDKFCNQNGMACCVRKQLGLENTKYIILFAPTYRSRGESWEIPFGLSTRNFLKCLNELCENIDAICIFRQHMNSKLRLFETGFPKIKIICQKDYPETNNLLTAVDLVITDWSSIACDFYALHRPVIYVDNPIPSYDLSEALPINRVGDHVKNFNEFALAVKKNLQLGKDEIDEMLSEVLDQCYGGTLDGYSSQRYDTAIKGLLHNNLLLEEQTLRFKKKAQV